MKILINNEIKDHKEAFPNFSFPGGVVPKEFAVANNAYIVSEKRDFDGETQKLVPCDPEIEDDVAYIVRVVEKTQSDLDADRDAQAIFVRSQRDVLLEESDWTQGKDISDAVSSSWAVYRQALRDLPTQEGFPSTVVWPSKPE